MSQKGFIKILIIAIVVAIIGTIGYFILVKNFSAPSEKQGAFIPNEKEIIRVLFPKGGERLEIGDTYEIRWENYIGDEPLTIALQVTTLNGKTYLKKIAENIPPIDSGSYRWTVTSEPTDSKYKIEIYPEDNRTLVGRSKDFFFITGDPLITVATPKPLEEVTSPLKISGKARRIFNEGEFIVRLVGHYLSNKPVLANTIVYVQDCDWSAGDWCDFEVQLFFPSEKIKNALAMVEFYQRDEKFGEKLIYKFPISGKKTPAGKTENLIVDFPIANQTVTSPIIIRGKARKIFFEGEFRVDLIAYDYPLGHPKYVESSRVIDSTNASIVGDCDWLTGEWCNFRATINYSSGDIGVEYMLYFYDGGQGEPGTPQSPKFILALPINLK